MQVRAEIATARTIAAKAKAPALCPSVIQCAVPLAGNAQFIGGDIRRHKQNINKLAGAHGIGFANAFLAFSLEEQVIS
jgi:hypothetical protein